MIFLSAMMFISHHSGPRVKQVFGLDTYQVFDPEWSSPDNPAGFLALILVLNQLEKYCKTFSLFCMVFSRQRLKIKDLIKGGGERRSIFF